MIGKLICWIKKTHVWRRPHVGEPADSRYCKRCGTGRPVKKRKAKA